MRYIIIFIIFLVPLCASAQTKNIVLKYENGSISVIQVPESASIKSSDQQIILSTPYATLQIPCYNIKQYFVANDKYIGDSINNSTPRLILDSQGIIANDPNRTYFATLMTSDFVGIKVFPPDKPIQFYFQEYKPGIYVFPLCQKSKVHVSFK